MKERLYPVNVRVEREAVKEHRREAMLRKVSPSALIRQLLQASLLLPPDPPIKEGGASCGCPRLQNPQKK